MAYGSDASFTTWLASMGLSLPAEAPTPAILRAIGSSYLDATYGKRYSGRVADPTQVEEWPRIGAYRGDTSLSSDIVPVGIENASYFAAYYAANNPDVFFGGATGTEISKRETVGPLTFEYAVPSNMTAEQLAIMLQPILPLTDGLVGPFLEDKNEPKVFLMSIGDDC